MFLEYDDFYRLVWGNYISEYDVSLQYRENNKDFIYFITFSFWRKYQTQNVHESVYAESIKLFFVGLFLYKPDNFNLV
jgi:hypothetical protein